MKRNSRLRGGEVSSSDQRRGGRERNNRVEIESVRKRGEGAASAALGSLIVAITAVLALPDHAAAQVVRQESTNPLKKVVYTYDVTALESLARLTRTGTFECDDGLGNPIGTGLVEYYEAVIPIPEYSPTNIPSVQILQRQTNHYVGKRAYLQRDGTVFLEDWKESYSITLTSYFGSNITLVVVYEPTSGLTVANAGTGKSLELKWQPAPVAPEKLKGYKVLRREKKEQP